MKLPKTFFGWANLKWLLTELLAMYSTKDSYFSKKRFESAIAFISATGLILCHAYYTRATITNSEILADAALLFAIAGYTVNHIQKEKCVPTDPAATPAEPEVKAEGSSPENLEADSK